MTQNFAQTRIKKLRNKQKLSTMGRYVPSKVSNQPASKPPAGSKLPQGSTVIPNWLNKHKELQKDVASRKNK